MRVVLLLLVSLPCFCLPTNRNNHDLEDFGKAESSFSKRDFISARIISHFEFELIWTLAMQQSDPGSQEENLLNFGINIE